MIKIDEFLRAEAMHPDLTDIEETSRLFMQEMDLGLQGKPSSLQMIPSYINALGHPAEDVPVICIDAGGTNLRVGLVTFKDGLPLVTKIKKSPMPGSKNEITAEEFFDELADKILPLTAESSKISFCFSYPAEVFENRDGKILQLNKEVRVRGANGMIIGRELIKKLKEKGASKDFEFTLLNDTAAGLMGGIASLDLGHCDGFAGLILGTGNNSCYLERGENIKKLENPGDMLINCESGMFDKPSRGSSDLLLDAASEIPGDHLLEKMMSGVYHGAVITHTIRASAKKGMLSAGFAGEYDAFSSLELDDFLRGENNRVAKLCAGDDREKITYIIDCSFERAAKLVCANIAALCLHCDGGKSPEHPFCVVAEGSSFHNSLLFRAKLDKYLDEYIKGKLGRFISIYRADNSTMAGAALAALLN